VTNTCHGTGGRFVDAACLSTGGDRCRRGCALRPGLGRARYSGHPDTHCAGSDDDAGAITDALALAVAVATTARFLVHFPGTGGIAAGNPYQSTRAAVDAGARRSAGSGRAGHGRASDDGG
jgi:hypothetical protein